MSDRTLDFTSSAKCSECFRPMIEKVWGDAGAAVLIEDFAGWTGDGVGDSGEIYAADDRVRFLPDPTYDGSSFPQDKGDIGCLAWTGDHPLAEGHVSRHNVVLDYEDPPSQMSAYGSSGYPCPAESQLFERDVVGISFYHDGHPWFSDQEFNPKPVPLHFVDLQQLGQISSVRTTDGGGAIENAMLFSSASNAAIPSADDIAFPFFTPSPNDHTSPFAGSFDKLASHPIPPNSDIGTPLADDLTTRTSVSSALSSSHYWGVPVQPLYPLSDPGRPSTATRPGADPSAYYSSAHLSLGDFGRGGPGLGGPRGPGEQTAFQPTSELLRPLLPHFSYPPHTRAYNTEMQENLAHLDTTLLFPSTRRRSPTHTPHPFIASDLSQETMTPQSALGPPGATAVIHPLDLGGAAPSSRSKPPICTTASSATRSSCGLITSVYI
ncbi:hypothetical protein FA95DRAFT_1682584 [Auriscalpium vulgare]|uniref:Uncharacterized protein n=1 Tax=Auriscalpium vulgare TaxID=40419 RepID=A0ACB8RFK0_9AGAM|nr:hypothetical protein FA95DRAFT_1682584 [Auriscalpium vulgare]